MRNSCVEACKCATLRPRYITQLGCKLSGRAECPLPSQWQHTVIFGGLQVLMSQLPNLER